LENNAGIIKLVFFIKLWQITKKASLFKDVCAFMQNFVDVEAIIDDFHANLVFFDEVQLPLFLNLFLNYFPSKSANLSSSDHNFKIKIEENEEVNEKE
jgi:hypothetical protein